MPLRRVPDIKAGDRHPRGKWDSPERRKERQKEYMKKHGQPEPRRKRLAVTDKYKKVRAALQGGGRTNLLEELGRVEAEPSNRNRRAEISRVHGELNRGYKGGGRIGLKSGKSPPKGLGPKGRPTPQPDWKDRLKDLGRRYRRPKENLIEKLGGSEKAKPHSTKEGRVASGERRIRRILKAGDKPKPRPPGRELPKWKKRPERIMTPLRAKHGIGNLVKKVITKIKPKPKKGLGSGIKPSEAKDILKSPGKSWGKTRADYLRAYSPYFGGKSIKKEVKSAKGKAAGGRIGLQHGSRPRPSGPHTWVKSGGAVLKGKKVGIQIK